LCDSPKVVTFNMDWGIKTDLNVSSRAKNELHEQVLKLIKKGTGLIILGCTELPLAAEEHNYPGTELLDPMRVLARALVKAADPDKLRL
ncbi:MAG TPA: hypothetical protein DCO79_16715, partial [Spirochaeta sp.]|nr:hypothetical protein [Spirochaeta sp.]